MPSNPLLQTSSTLVGQEASAPYDGQGQALAKAGEAIVGAVAGIQTRTIQNDVQAVTDEAIATAVAGQQAAQGPIDSDVIAKAIGGTADQVDDPDNAVIRPVLESIARLKLANEQGTINVDEVKIRQENILRAAIARHPTFAAQFIQGAAQQLGYNPIGSTVDALAARGQRTGQPKTQADEIEEYYEKQGDLLNVDRTLKFSNPAAWYSAVQKEISFNQGLQRDTREYQLAVVTRQTTEEQALNNLRAINMPQYGRKVVTDLMNSAQHFATMTAEQRNLAISRGELDNLRTQIAAARVGLYQHIRTMNGNLENYLTTEQINEASRDVLAQLEYAEKATDPVAALQGVKNHLESVVLEKVDFKYPEFGVLDKVTRMLGNMPTDSLVAKKYSEQMASSLALGINQMVGGILNNKDPNQIRPAAVIDPAIAPNMPPAQRAQVTRDVAKSIHQELLKTPNDPISRRATVRTVSAFANEYNTMLTTTGTAPDQETAQIFINMAADDKFYEIVNDPDVSMEDVAGLVPMNEVMAAEAMDTGVEMAQDIKGRFAPATLSPEDRARMSQPYAGYDPVARQLGKTQSVPLNHVVNISWQEGRAILTPVPENDAIVMSRNLNYPELLRITSQFNLKYSKRLTSIVKASAHTSGSDDYNNFAVVIDGLFNNIRVTLPE